MIARMPLLSESSPSPISKPSRLSISSWFSTRSDRAAPMSSPRSAAPPKGSSSLSAARVSVMLGHQHFFDQHGVHLARRGDQVDPAQDLGAQLIGAGRSGQ